MKPILFLAVAALISGCAKENGSTPSKNLFSLWTADANQATLDLRAANFGSQTIGFLFVGGASCSCTMNISGSQSSGTYTLSGCSYVSGGGGDPGCASLNGSGTYTNAGAVLSICTSSCSTYR